MDDDEVIGVKDKVESDLAKVRPTTTPTSSARHGRSSSLTPSSRMTPPLSGHAHRLPPPQHPPQSPPELVVGVDRNTPSPDVGLLIPEMADAATSKTVTGRRRSFAMTTKGHLVNEGDVIIGSHEDDCMKNAEAISAVRISIKIEIKIEIKLE